MLVKHAIFRDYFHIKISTTVRNESLMSEKWRTLVGGGTCDVIVCYTISTLTINWLTFIVITRELTKRRK